MMAKPAWYTESPSVVADKLGTDRMRGLSKAEAEKRLKQYGPNTLKAAHERSLFSLFVAQFNSLIVLLLIAATGISVAVGEYPEAIAILIVIFLNAIIGFLTEWKAKQALSALRKQMVHTATVIREGNEQTIEAPQLVPGDIVTVAAGSRVPADGRVFESVELQVDESSLTGESQPVFKTTESLVDHNIPLGDQTNMLFMGTTVTAGRGKIVVTETGMNTQMGEIGALIQDIDAEKTPLEQKLESLGRVLVVFVLILAVVVIIGGLLRGNDLLHMLEVGISLAIAAVPEGLPAVATMTLAIGMQRMARKRALIRRLPAVETLGATTVICTDKTGTLTKNEMTVTRLILDPKHIHVTGLGYEPKGSFRLNKQEIRKPLEEHDLAVALKIGALCNDASIDRSGPPSILGDPTEAALIVLAEKAGFTITQLRQEYPRVGEIPFSSETKWMVTVHKTPDNTRVAYVKGSARALLNKSRFVLHEAKVDPITAQDIAYFEEQNARYASRALRVLGLAYRDLPDQYDEEDLKRDLVFVGLVGMIDPLRDEAKHAIAICREAGIRTIMITGDQKDTAYEIARQLGLLTDPSGQPYDVVHATALTSLDEQGWDAIVKRAAVFSRVSPKHKLQIVDALQRQGHIVAMTGDGVNDAPALKKADIGVAMGIKGTDVAKESADMVITDDNFATIVSAVEQGRIIYTNILKFIHYLFSCNFSEILTVFFALLIGWPLPLGPLQILWLNMITDVFPALALALEPSAPGMMKRPPRNPNIPLVNAPFFGLITWQGIVLAAAALGVFSIGLTWYAGDVGVHHAMTMAFMTLAFSQIVHGVNVRSQTDSLFRSAFFSNPWLLVALFVCTILQVLSVSVPFLQNLLHTVPLGIHDWGVVITASLMPIVIVEAVKKFQKSAAYLKKR